MNFLGHAYLARNSPELMAGNFAGDGYKGALENFKHLPKHILDGVKLHRQIDHLTDTNSHINQACLILQEKGVRKVAPIAIDIIVDYFLSSHWANYHHQSYEDFLTQVYLNTDANLEHLHPKFCMMYERLKRYKWMHQYNTIEGMSQIIWQFSRRIPFKNDLQLAYKIYQDDPDELNELFHAFLTNIDAEIQDFIKFRLIE